MVRTVADELVIDDGRAVHSNILTLEYVQRPEDGIRQCQRPNEELRCKETSQQ